MVSLLLLVLPWSLIVVDIVVSVVVGVAVVGVAVLHVDGDDVSAYDLFICWLRARVLRV